MPNQAGPGARVKNNPKQNKVQNIDFLYKRTFNFSFFQYKTK